jgi:hypothetical protein
MPLLNDGPIAQLEDLRSYETSVLDTASVEGVALSPKIDMAQREVSTEILRFLISQLEPAETVTPAMLDRVVVTDPLLRWHTLHTLELFFRDVHHNQINDRYKAKWQAYEEESRAAQRLLFEVGVGLVSNPLFRPASPVVTASPGVVTGPVLIRVAWLRAASESAASEAVLFNPGDSTDGPMVSMSAAAPAGTTGWNVYAGLPDGALTRQNNEPIAVGESWSMPPAGLAEGGAAPPKGQGADRWIRQRRVFLRG